MKKTIKKSNKSKKIAESNKSAYFKLFLKKINIFKKDFRKSITPGSLREGQVRILILIFLIIFSSYVVFFKQYYYRNFFVAEVKLEQRSLEEMRRERFEKELTALVEGHPIEAMVPYIAEKDKETAAYLVAIAKKESNWGKRRPVLDGKDCYNYWGFRAKSEHMGSGGHTCFNNPRQAVNVVSKRIAQIIERNDVESAKDMIVWKCGSNCDVTGGQAAADKWIRDVDLYAKKVLN